VQILLNIIRHNGLSSSFVDKNKLYYANICLFDAYNAIGMNMLFLSKSNGHIYLNSIYDDNAWFNVLGDQNGLTLNKGVINNDEVIISNSTAGNEGDNGIGSNTNVVNEEDNISYITLDNSIEIDGYYSDRDDNVNDDGLDNLEYEVDDYVSVNKTINELMDEITNNVAIVSAFSNQYQFKYKSGAFSKKFGSLNELVHNVCTMFGEDYSHSVVTIKKNNIATVIVDGSNKNNEDNLEVSQAKINDILRCIKIAVVKNGFRYYRGNLPFTGYTAKTEVELATYIYSIFKDTWRENVKLKPHTDVNDNIAIGQLVVATSYSPYHDENTGTVYGDGDIEVNDDNITVEHDEANTIFHDFDANVVADNNTGENVVNEISEVEIALEEIKTSVRIYSHHNRFQFRSKNGKLSKRFNTILELCKFIYASFGKNYENYVMTCSQEKNNIVEADPVFPADIINDIMASVAYSITSKSNKYKCYDRNNLVVASIISDTHEELAKRIYQKWKENWRQNVKCIDDKL